MKFTNTKNLPKGIVDAIIKDSYTKGDADFSVSQLFLPAQILRLMSLHWDEIEVDVSEEIWKLLGTAVHYILEQQQLKPKLEEKFNKQQAILAEAIQELGNIVNDIGATDKVGSYWQKKLQQVFETLQGSTDSSTEGSSLQVEERLYGSLAGYVISGKPDWLDLHNKEIQDYKVTSVWKILKGDYEEYTHQANAYRWLAWEHHGELVHTLQINAILRDWKLGEMKRNPEYPRVQVEKLNLPMRSLIETTEKLLERLKLHQLAKKYQTAEELAENISCTPEERWHKPDKWKIKKKGGSRAVPGGVFTEDDYSSPEETKEAAEKLLAEKGDDYELEHTPGEDTRCQLCIVRQFCKQYNQTTVHVEETPSLAGDFPKELIDDLPKDNYSEENIETDTKEIAEKSQPEETFDKRWERQKKETQEYVEKNQKKMGEQIKEPDTPAEESSEDAPDNTFLERFKQRKEKKKPEDKNISDILKGLDL